MTLGVYAQYPPSVGSSGTTAIYKDSSVIVGWANKVISFSPGPQDISDVASPLADFGDSTNALGYAEGNSTDVISLGDAGSITLSFPFPIMNGVGYDFAVFENSFANDFLEFAHVEVSSDGVNFIRFPSHSLVQTDLQTGSFDLTATEEINNLAGKYQQGYGTPFDLEELVDSNNINLDSVQYVRIIDVVGSIDSNYGSTDSYGNYINEPFPTFFPSGGFDLDGIGMINVNGVFVSGLVETKSEISIYPVPTNSILNIESIYEGHSSLNIFNMNGQLVHQQEFYSALSLNLVDLEFENGVYLIVLSDKNGVLRKRIVFNGN